MFIRPCELDSRIRSLYDIQTCLEYDDKFLNEEGYFAHTLSDFSNLEDCDFGKLVSVDVDNIRYIFNRDNVNRFELFIPECLLLKPEKKYRPFSIREFEDMLASKKDDFICFRFKLADDKVSNLFHKLRYLGYVLTEDENFEEPGEGCLYFGNYISGSPKYLFEHLELLSDDGKWVPFGIEVSKDD